MSGLSEHLKSGLTSVCRCWKIVRKDGVTFGFTDHDVDLLIDGITYQAGSGLSPSVVSKATGLSVDNSEAIGALDSERLTENDIRAGLFDGAEVVALLVNWQDTASHAVTFRGKLGEIMRKGGQFRAEIRGLSEALNQPKGRVFQKSCGAVLGDSACGFDVLQLGYFADGEVVSVSTAGQFDVDVGGGHADQWFERGVVEFPESDLPKASIKRDDARGDLRALTLWQELYSAPVVGTPVRLIAGCDRRMLTCQNKFNNISNFQGFPDLPGEDWVMKMPGSGQVHDGGSRR